MVVLATLHPMLPALKQHVRVIEPAICFLLKLNIQAVEAQALLHAIYPALELHMYMVVM